MARLGHRTPNTPIIWATPTVVADPDVNGGATSAAEITADVTASSIYPRTLVYVYGIKDRRRITRPGRSALVLCGVEPGDINPGASVVQGDAVAGGHISADLAPPAVIVIAIAAASITAAATSEPIFYFTTPTIRERRFSRRHRLWDRMYLHRGLTIIRFGDSYQQIDNPSTDEMESADALFIGGRTYLITEAEAVRLTAAGYGNWVNDSPDEPIEEIDFSQYGAGAYGSGAYGA